MWTILYEPGKDSNPEREAYPGEAALGYMYLVYMNPEA